MVECNACSFPSASLWQKIFELELLSVLQEGHNMISKCHWITLYDWWWQLVVLWQGRSPNIISWVIQTGHSSNTGAYMDMTWWIHHTSTRGAHNSSHLIQHYLGANCLGSTSGTGIYMYVYLINLGFLHPCPLWETDLQSSEEEHLVCPYAPSVICNHTHNITLCL